MPRQSGFGWAWRVPLALAGSLAGHPSGIWHRGLHDQGVPARPPPVVDLRQRLAEYAGQGVQQLPD
ncbi:hypothetical protein HKT35_31340, partial [Pseudomonas aeruginosa]|nr:hypothetical protein [Pseudomonas aeruginosa]